MFFLKPSIENINQLDAKFAQINAFLKILMDEFQRQQLMKQHALDFFKLGNEQYMLEHYEAALACYDQAFILDSNVVHNIGYFNNRGITKYRLGNYEEALADCDRAIELDPTNAIYFYSRGMVKDSLGLYKEALADCSQAIDLDPSNAAYFYSRAKIQDDLGFYAEALTDCREALRLNPENKKIANKYALILGHMSKKDSYTPAQLLTTVGTFTPSVNLKPVLTPATENTKDLSL